MVQTISELKTRIDDYLGDHLAADVDQDTLYSSMRYSLMAGGKRLRPALTLATVEMLGGEIDEDVMHAATALELLHT